MIRLNQVQAGSAKERLARTAVNKRCLKIRTYTRAGRTLVIGYLLLTESNVTMRRLTHFIGP